MGYIPDRVPVMCELCRHIIPGENSLYARLDVNNKKAILVCSGCLGKKLWVDDEKLGQYYLTHKGQIELACKLNRDKEHLKSIETALNKIRFPKLKGKSFMDEGFEVIDKRRKKK